MVIKMHNSSFPFLYLQMEADKSAKHLHELQGSEDMHDNQSLEMLEDILKKRDKEIAILKTAEKARVCNISPIKLVVLRVDDCRQL